MKQARLLEYFCFRMISGIKRVGSMFVRAAHNTNMQVYSQNSFHAYGFSCCSSFEDEIENQRLMINNASAAEMPSIVGDAS